MNTNNIGIRSTALAISMSLFTSLIIAPIAVQASEEGQRNTTLGLSAIAAALLLTQKNKIPGIVAAAGAAYSYKTLNDDIKSRHRRERSDDYYRDRDSYRSQDERNSRKRSRYEDSSRYGDREIVREEYSRESDRNCKNSREDGDDRYENSVSSSHRNSRAVSRRSHRN